MADGFHRRDMERPTTHRAFVQQLLGREDGRFNTVDYVGISLPRFTYTITLCKNLKPSQDTKVLDVGRSYLSFLLAQHYVSVCTLGIPLGEHGYAHEYAGLDHERRPQNHITFNLNDAQEQGIETEQQFDLIVFAEVLDISTRHRNLFCTPYGISSQRMDCLCALLPTPPRCRSGYACCKGSIRTSAFESIATIQAITGNAQKTNLKK